MKTDLDTLKKIYKHSQDTYYESRIEAQNVRDLYEGRAFSYEALDQLYANGLHAETYNFIKLYTKIIVGFFSTIANTVTVKPKKDSEIIQSKLLKDIVNTTMSHNNFDSEGDNIKIDGLLSGIMCVYIELIPNGEFDQFKRPLYEIKLSHVPTREIFLDPSSRKEDYSDARYIHRYKYLTRDSLRNMLRSFHSKKKANELIEQLNKNATPLDIDGTINANNQSTFNGVTDDSLDKFEVIHTVIRDDDNKVWSIYWSNDIELVREEVTFREVTFPYRVQKIIDFQDEEYYGYFRDLIGTQRAINDALTRLQTAFYGKSIIIEKNAVEDLNQTSNQFYGLNNFVIVNDINGVRVDDLTRQSNECMSIIREKLRYAQNQLGITDSFLGNAYASDSGKKVKLQQNSSVMVLRDIRSKLEQFYKMVGFDIVRLVKQYFTAEQAFMITDEQTGDRWIEINKPFVKYTGRVNPDGSLETEYIYEKVLDPDTNKPLLDVNKNFIYAPIPQEESEIYFTNFDIAIESVAYNDDTERNEQLLQQFLQGNLSQYVAQFDPESLFRIAGEAVKGMGTKNSYMIAEIYNNIAEKIKQQQQAQELQAQQLQAQQLQAQQTQQLAQSGQNAQIGGDGVQDQLGQLLKGGR